VFSVFVVSHASKRSVGTVTAPLTEPIVVAEFWANRRGESIRIQLREFEGVALVDVRKHYTGAEGKLLPTKKGLSLVIRRLPDLAAAITKALEKARELGLIRDEGRP
jgi:Transcriptional Coactivator p15 (PC4)